MEVMTEKKIKDITIKKFKACMYFKTLKANIGKKGKS